MKKTILLILALCLFLLPACSKTESAGPFEPGVMSISVWYPDENVIDVHPETRSFPYVQKEDIPLYALRELYVTPADPNLVTILSGSVEDILSVTVKDSTAFVDLSQEFVSKNTGGTSLETMVIRSMVNTLCELDGIEKVQFMVQGDPNAPFGGHFTIDEPFYPSK
ncbi:MAG: GerMN domain-containing protein [Oscillospiraceae bacterium]|nr:GerMN domain-containing protein [Oscillospiraceae bacterium]